MKQLISMLFIAVIICSCNTAAQKPPLAAATASTIKAADKPAPIAATITDPVCEMPWDTSWTDITVYEQDTLKFCSEACKKTFLARPAKYVKGKAGKNI